MSTPRCLYSLFCVSLVGQFLSGCGSDGPPPPKLYRVTGTVTYKGQAVPGAKVMFLGDGKSPPAVGVTDDAGKFTLSSLAGTGAVAGKHAVVIVKNTEAEPANVMMSMEEAALAAQNPPEPPKETSLIPVKYANAATSGLEFEVQTSGDNEFNIELTD